SPQSRPRSSSTRLSGSVHSRRYRTRALTSHVDETLFGTTKQVSHIWPWGQSQSAPSQNTQKPETVRIITKDLIRDLKIPSEDPSGLSIILRPSEIQRIATASRVPTREEREAMLEAQQKEREMAMDAAEERKAHIRQADLSRQKNQGLSELEAEAKERAQYLLERANAMRMEQEDEVKKLNELILGAQCHAVRDAQILERQQILTELQEEERRLDAMMEVDRHSCSHKQTKTNLTMLQDEIKEQEGQQMLENLERIQMEVLEALERKKEERQRLQQEILRINEESFLAKERKNRRDLLTSGQWNTPEREAEYEAEQRRIMREKEKEVARLRAMQERERDHKDELRARRNQEAAERDWRKKEKEQLKKKAEVEERLKAARLQQVTHKEHLLSIEAGRERAEFERVLRAQQASISKEKEKEEKHRIKLLRHAEVVRQQVREREMQAIALRKEIYKEGDRLEKYFKFPTFAAEDHEV
uniref:Cilia- and flagella-associated protein 45 n=1 Tax=Esox lucius TaxID=8010 RepID=A0AAY5KAY7_ESOLU